MGEKKDLWPPKKEPALPKVQFFCGYTTKFFLGMIKNKRIGGNKANCRYIN